MIITWYYGRKTDWHFFFGDPSKGRQQIQKDSANDYLYGKEMQKFYDWYKAIHGAMAPGAERDQQLIKCWHVGKYVAALVLRLRVTISG